MARESQIKYCPRCGTTVKREKRFDKVHPVCPNCDWIHFNDPKVAAAVLVEQDGHVLLVRRVNEPYRSLWTLPAGFVDAGEVFQILDQRRDSFRRGRRCDVVVL